MTVRSSRANKVLAENGTAMMAAGVNTLAIALGMDAKQANAMLIDMMGTATKHLQASGKLGIYNALMKR